MNKCALCFRLHDNQWTDGPNMYCEPCVPIREASRHKADHIIENLYLGDMAAAGEFDGLRMCVHELGPLYEGQCVLHPVLIKRPNTKWDRTGAVASVEQLDAAAQMIEHYVVNGDKLLVHCFGGIERSPLTLAWWLVKSGRYENIRSAYEFLQTKRPVVSQRLFWLPRDHEWFEEQP